MKNTFAHLVYEMRKAQTEYFRNRDKSVLIRSKQLEKKVDDQLVDVLRERYLIIDEFGDIRFAATIGPLTVQKCLQREIAIYDQERRQYLFKSNPDGSQYWTDPGYWREPA